MSKRSRSNLVVGLLLIIIGGWFLVVQFVPEIATWVNLDFSWPIIIIGFGILLFVMGLLIQAPGMAVPAVIISGIGGILYWQNATGNWESWTYAWSLIPGFVGIGVLISGLLGGTPRQNLRDGGQLLIISAVLFIIFGSLAGAFGDSQFLFPLAIIFLGVWLLLRGFVKRS